MKTFPLEKYGTTRPIQLQVAAYMNGNLAIEMIPGKMAVLSLGIH